MRILFAAPFIREHLQECGKFPVKIKSLWPY